MSYVEKVLLPGERVVYAPVLHWIIYVQGLFITALGGVFGVGSKMLLVTFVGAEMARHYVKLPAGIALVIVFCGVVLLLGAYLRQISTELVITDRRIIAKYGVISRATYEIMLNRVTGANFDQSILGRLCGYGLVLVHGAGGETSPFDVVANPAGFHRALMDTLPGVRG